MENRLRELPEGVKGYIAAFLDCEGYISVRLAKGVMGRRNDRFALRAGFANTHFPTIQKLYNLLGIGTLRKELRSDGKDIYRFQVDCKMDIWCLLDAVKPYLSVKRKHAELASEFIESQIVGSLTYKRALDIHNELKILNNRPKSELISG